MITAVCISKERHSFGMDIPFVCYTQEYEPITTHDNNDMNRITYLTKRYNNAIGRALDDYPNTRDLLVIDHYYLGFYAEIEQLIRDYLMLDHAILGASIWYWARKRIRPWIAYYDTLSVPELFGKRWSRIESLPTEIMAVTGVGGCWIFPRVIWERTDGFTIPSPPQAGGSRCLETTGYRVLLDCKRRLWRTHETNPGIPEDPMMLRVLNSAKGAERKLLRLVRRSRV